MKIIVFSDSHRDFNSMMKAIERESNIDMIIHAGDVLSDVEDLKIMYPQYNIVYVKGNNDLWDRDAAEDRFFEVEGIKIFLTHGHNYSVKYSKAALAKKGAELGADICIFGHTHQVCNEVSGNITLFNPGAASRRYGIIETNQGKFSVRVCDL